MPLSMHQLHTLLASWVKLRERVPPFLLMYVIAVTLSIWTNTVRLVLSLTNVCSARNAASNGQVEKQDTSGNERERECESETVDY